MTKLDSGVGPSRTTRLLPRTERTHQPVAREEAPVLHDLMSPEQNVQRIMWTGTIWFSAAVGSVAVALGLLLASGWRPVLLTGAVRVLWWGASAVVTLAIGLIGWSGCPILEVDVPTASRNKSLTMQLGTMTFIIGSAAAMLAVLLGPAA